MIPERFNAFLERLGQYPAWEVLVELALFALLVYVVLVFVRGTRAAGALRGVLVVLLVFTLVRVLGAGGENFQRLTFLYDRFLTLIAVGLLIVFQPELRRALVRLGETPLFRTTSPELVQTIEAICLACGYFRKNRFGAIIALERRVGLAGLVEEGTPIGAEVSADLLQTIFFPGTALHDMAVVIKGRIIHAAGVQLPLAEPGDMPDARLGTRHRAAIGLTRECDALVIVVSEETGSIRLAERGRFTGPMEIPELEAQLLSRLRGKLPAAEASTAEETFRDEALQREPIPEPPPETPPETPSEPAADTPPEPHADTLSQPMESQPMEPRTNEFDKGRSATQTRPVAPDRLQSADEALPDAGQPRRQDGQRKARGD